MLRLGILLGSANPINLVGVAIGGKRTKAQMPGLMPNFDLPVVHSYCRQPGGGNAFGTRPLSKFSCGARVPP